MLDSCNSRAALAQTHTQTQTQDTASQPLCAVSSATTQVPQCECASDCQSSSRLSAFPARTRENLQQLLMTGSSSLAGCCCYTERWSVCPSFVVSLHPASHTTLPCGRGPHSSCPMQSTAASFKSYLNQGGSQQNLDVPLHFNKGQLKNRKGSRNACA